MYLVMTKPGSSSRINKDGLIKYPQKHLSGRKAETKYVLKLTTCFNFVFIVNTGKTYLAG